MRPLVLALIAAGALAIPASQARALSAAAPAPVPLAQGWHFAPDPANTGERRGWPSAASGRAWQAVSLPHVFDPRPLPELFGGTVGWYSLRFTPPALPTGFRWDASFEQVRRQARVWLNGRPVGSHADPYTSFEVSLSGLRPGAPNTLVVRVDNRKGSQPREGWWNWGGITRAVSLVPRGPVLLRDPALLGRVSCRGPGRCRDAHFVLDGWLVNRTSRSLAPQVTVVLRAPGSDSATTEKVNVGKLGPGALRHLSASLPVAGKPALWDPEHPNLYTATVQTSAGGQAIQVDRLPAGLRSVTVRGGLLHLNGRRADLRGASIEEDVPGHGPALTPADMDSIVSGLKAVHATVTRAQYGLNPGLLDRLDRAGILVWSQAPIYHRDLELQTAPQRSSAMATLLGTLLQARGHPSVLTQSVANELTPTPDQLPSTATYLRSAVTLVHRVDPGLPVSLDLLSYPGYPRERAYESFDLLGINNYFGWYPGRADHSTASIAGLAPYLRLLHARYPRQAMLMTEFGAEATISGPAWEKQTYAFQQQYLKRTLNIVDALPFMSGAVYWTLHEFAVKPHWDGGAHRRDLPRDSIHHKGLIAYDGARKPAWATAADLFAARSLYPSAAASLPGPSLLSTLAAILALGALIALVAALSAVALWSFAGLRAGVREPALPAPTRLPLGRRERRADSTYG